MPRRSINPAGSCCIFVTTIVLLGVYFYYELFVHSNLRFPRDNDEAADMYNFAEGTILNSPMNRFSFDWWFIQTHHLFGFGVALIGIVHSLSKDFGIGDILGIVCCGYFTIVSFALFFSIWVWFLYCNAYGSGCPILRERAHEVQIDDGVRFQIPLFYFIMLILSSCVLVPFTLYFFRKTSDSSRNTEDDDDDDDDDDDGDEISPLLNKNIFSSMRSYSKKLQKNRAKDL